MTVSKTYIVGGATIIYEAETVDELFALVSRFENGWITWNGGARPVSGDTLVTAIDRDDEVYNKILAGNLRWEWNDSSGDIVAYRVVS